MSAPALTPPPRPVITPRECEAQRDGAKCQRPARLFPSGWRCIDDAPGTSQLPPAQAA